MTDTANDDTGVVELVGLIMKNSADQATLISDTLLAASHEREIQLAEALVELADAVETQPMVSRKLMNVLNKGSLSSALVLAERLVADKDRQS